jgi:MoxR-vWA-beta-propeller ternary system protein
MPPEGGTPDFRARQTRCGCMLHIAEWPGGSKAFLDSRGLLHFKSHDPTVPEVSLVLSEGDIAGWTSDGHVCGPSFFFDGPQTSEPLEVFERLRQFLARL